MIRFSENFYIVGHRGAAGECFENSLEGFHHTIDLAVDGIEIDIREHSSEFWVIHDQHLERLCGIDDLFDNQADMSQIRLKNGEPVPTLRQLLDLTWGKVPLNIEIKAIDNPDSLLQLLAEYPPLPSQQDLPWVLISSFNHRVLLDLSRLGCPWPLAPLSSGIPIHVEPVIESLKPWSWHFDDEYLDFDLVDALSQKNIQSFVFTVNDAERAKALNERGISGIFTDIPSKMIQFY